MATLRNPEDVLAAKYSMGYTLPSMPTLTDAGTGQSPLAAPTTTKVGDATPTTKPQPTTYTVGGVNVTPQTQATTQQSIADYMPATTYPMGSAGPQVMPGSAPTPVAGTVQPYTAPAPAPVPAAAPVPAPSVNPTSTTPTGATLPAPVPPIGTPLGDAMPVGGTSGNPYQEVPGATVTPFGPGNDLQYQAILPGQGTDRLGLAQQYFDQFAQSTDPAYQQTLRAATQRAAANGILGSGMLTNTYGDVATQRAQALDLARRGYLTDALQASIQDAINNRNELRTERGYQSGTNQQAITDQINQLLLQDQLGGNAFDRQLQLAQLLGQLGYAGNPDQALLTGSQAYQGQADQTYQLIAQLLGQLGQRQAGG